MIRLKYEELLEEGTINDIYIIENADFRSRADGLISGNVIGINRNIRTSRQRTCVLAEELGHHYTTVGNILDQSIASNRKQEYRARLWAYNKLIGLHGIISAHKSGCRNISDVAEYLDVTEAFLLEALQCYKQKYGLYVKLDNYVVYFEPSIGVFETNGDMTF